MCEEESYTVRLTMAMGRPGWRYPMMNSVKTLRP